MRAIVSDIHGNLEALQAVLAGSQQQVTSMYNLGDTTGQWPLKSTHVPSTAKIVLFFLACDEPGFAGEADGKKNLQNC
jgi:hypothetical protein